MPLAWISLTLSHHLSLSSVGLGRSSMLHPVSVQSSCSLVLARCPTIACLCEGVHRSTLLMSSPLLLQQCPECCARLIWMVFKMDGRCPYSCCHVGCCLLDLFNTAHRILVQLLSSFLSIRFVSVHMVHLYNSTDTTTAWKNCVLFHLIGLTSIWPIVYW